MRERRHSSGVVWQQGRTARAERARLTGQSGATIWFTGLPASGKSTTAFAVEAELLAAGRSAYALDGDNVRHGLCGDLGFSPEDRRENVRRVAEVALLLADAGTVALVSLISPEASGRAEARALHERAGIAFVEVWMDTPLAICERRDPKGLYAKARSGALHGLTGIDAPYEVPAAPDVVLRSASASVEEEVDRVLAVLAEREGALGAAREGRVRRGTVRVSR